MMMIAMHKDVQQKAFEEVSKFFEDGSGEFTLDDVNNLPYVEMVLKETMRLYPAASMIGRQTTGPVQIGKYIYNFLTFQYFKIVFQENT